MVTPLKTILSIAGSDPTGGAGIQADIRAGNSLGLHVSTVLTAVTAQNSYGVFNLGVVKSELVEEQLSAVFEVVRPDAIKIGMTGSVQNLLAIVSFLKKNASDIPIVTDPVLKASADGKTLVNDDNLEKLLEAYRGHLFPISTAVTPNWEELKLLSGLEPLSMLELKRAAKKINVSNLILTGFEINKDVITDLFVGEYMLMEKPKHKLNCQNLHGTGCTFSTLMAAYLALGDPIHIAFSKASEKMEEIISKSCGYKFGNSNYGPLNVNNYTL